MRRYQRAVCRLAAAALLLASSGVLAQAYPAKPIRFLIPFAPGGIGDLTARVIAQKMSENLGQNILIDNRPGAGMIVSAEAALKADPDGYTMVLTGNGTAVSASLFKSLPYNILTDFTQVSMLATFDLVLLANAGSQFNSVNDVIAFARENPGKLNIGHISIGSTQSLVAELFKSTAQVEAQTVPFKATPAVMQALRSNDLHIAVDFLGPVMSQVKSQSLRALAILSSRRFPGLPEVPTIVEGGLPAFQASSWNGVSVRAGTPRPIVDRLAKEVALAVAAPEVKQRLQDLGAEGRSSTPEQMRDLMTSEIARWREVIERANIPRQ